METHSPTADQSPTKRKRLSLACNVCRRKKIKCDGIKPTCGKCERFQQTCSYTDIVRKRGPRQGHIDSLEQRLKKMEELITGGNSVLDASSSSLPIVQQPLMGHEVTAAAVTAAAEPTIMGLPLSPIRPPSAIDTIPSPSLYDSRSWPSPDIVDHLIEVYITYFETLTPIADFKALKTSIANKTCDTFLLFSLLSVAARFSNRSDIIENPLWMSGEKFASKAREMIATVIEQPTMEHIQGLLTLVVNEYGCARGPRCWMYVGIAIRMTVEIGLNKEIMLQEEQSGSDLSIERWFYYESRRRVFWETYLQDKLSSASTGKPQMMDICDTDMLLPVYSSSLDLTQGEFYQQSLDGQLLVRYTVVQNGNRIKMELVDLSNPRNQSLLNQVGLESRLTEACVLMGHVSRFVNRGHKNFVGHSLENNEFLQLNAELDAWAERLPLSLRNTPANLEFYRNQKNSLDAGLFVLTHILHNALIVLLNRPSLVLADMPRLGQVTQETQAMVQRSMEKCLAAADNVTVMLKDLQDKLSIVPPSTIYFAYTAATVMVNSTFSTNPDESKKAEAALGEFYKFFENMKVYWAMSDKLYFLIRDLYAVHRKVIDTYQNNQQESSSSTTTPHSNGSRNSYTWQSNTRSILADVSLSSSSNEFYSQNTWQSTEEPIFQRAVSSFDYWLQQQQEQRK